MKNLIILKEKGVNIRKVEILSLSFEQVSNKYQKSIEHVIFKEVLFEFRENKGEAITVSNK
ncbi:hypothetical protein ABET51_17170 [Metabacillus fastidiosus]|uniref:hypothetical protein n=1 Tax=Metabacillus fastidiosus TaxID=1458 RepID=UPI002E243DC5|nr:hypothetical protein [Metabacillus fastidiosus]